MRFAALMHDLGKGITPAAINGRRHHGHEGKGTKLVVQVCKRLKVPNDCRDLAVMTAREHGNVSRAEILRANTIVTLFERCDAFRKPERFAEMLLATECDARGREGNGVSFRDKPFPQLAHLETAMAAARGVNAGEIAQRTAAQPQRIPDLIHQALRERREGGTGRRRRRRHLSRAGLCLTSSALEAVACGFIHNGKEYIMANGLGSTGLLAAGLMSAVAACAGETDARQALGQATIARITGSEGRKVVDSLRDISPELGNWIVDFAYGDVFSRPGVPLCTRELATISALDGLGQRAAAAQGAHRGRAERRLQAGRDR